MADECCDFAVVRISRANGYGVLAIGESQSCSVDEDLIERAADEDRILLTEDQTFG